MKSYGQNKVCFIDWKEVYSESNMIIIVNIIEFFISFMIFSLFIAFPMSVAVFNQEFGLLLLSIYHLYRFLG